TKLGGVVNADDRISVPRHDVVHSGLELHHVVDPQPTLHWAGGVPDETGEREAPGHGTFEHLLDQGEHGILIEAAHAEKGLVPGAQFELATRLGGGHVDPLSLESPHIIRTLRGIDDMKGPLAALEALPNEGRHDQLLLIGAIEERADVTVLVQDASRELDRLAHIALDEVHVCCSPSGSGRDGVGLIDNAGGPTQMALSCPPAPVAA